MRRWLPFTTLALSEPKKMISAVLRAGTLDDFFQGVFRQEFDDWRLQAAVFAVGEVAHIVYFDVCQTFCAVDPDKFSVFVDFFAAEFRTVRYAQSDYAAAFHVGCATEDFEFFRFHQVGQLGKFQVDAHIRFVRAVVEHGFRVRHAWEIAQIYVLKHL